MTEYKPTKITIEVVRDNGTIETLEDMATAMRFIADEVEEGYTSGILGVVVWTTEGGNEP